MYPQNVGSCPKDHTVPQPKRLQFGAQSVFYQPIHIKSTSVQHHKSLLKHLKIPLTFHLYEVKLLNGPQHRLVLQCEIKFM
jgi:hypothetical protein